MRSRRGRGGRIAGTSATEGSTIAREQELFDAIAARDVVRVRAALDAGASVWAVDPATGARPLHVAAEAGSLDVVRELYERTPTVDPGSRDGRTPLVRALERGHVEVARFLAERRSGAPGVDASRVLPAFVDGPADDEALFAELLRQGFALDRAGDDDPPLARARRKRKSGIERAIVAHSAPAEVSRAVLADDAIELETLLAAAPGAASRRDADTGVSLLLLAARAGAANAARVLLSHGADVHETSPDPSDPLAAPLLAALDGGHVAAARAVLDRIERLSRHEAAHAIPSLVDHCADDGELTRALRAKGARTRWADDVPARALRRGSADTAAAIARANADDAALFAAVRSGDVSAVTDALAREPNVNEPEFDGGPSPLAVAAEAGDVAIVCALMDRGAVANEDAATDRRPAHVALRHGHVAAATAILGRSAGPRWSDGGRELAELAAAAPETDGAFVDAFLAAFVGVTVGPRAEWIATAAARGNLRLVTSLLERGVAPDGLHDAARAGHADVVRALAAAGADPSRTDANGDLAVHLAAASENALATVRALVAAGSPVRRTDAAGRTPAEIARSVGRPDADAVVAMLASAHLVEGGPTWLRDARARGADESSCYVVLLTRGDGLGFCPFDVRTPIRTGGDHDGFGHAATAAEGLDRWRRIVADDPGLRASVRWFEPFLDRLVRGADFGLDELESAAPTGVRLRRP